MKYVTYETTARTSRVGYLDGNEIVDVGFDGDMVAFIEAGAPRGTTSAAGTLGTTRLLAPLRPRTIRDFLAFEGHLKNAFAGLGKEIPDEWYHVPAYYKGLPDTVIGPGDEIPWPSYTEKLDHELELAAVIGRTGKDITEADGAGARLRVHDLERHVRSRRPDPRAPDRHGAVQGEGLGRLERPRALHRDRRRDRPARRRPRGQDQRRTLGRRQHQGHAPHLRVDDRLRLAGR